MAQKARQFKERAVFGTDEGNFPLLPAKFSNIKLSRLVNRGKMGVCSLCFPHGFDMINSHAEKRKDNNWKRFRRFQCKSIGTDAWHSA